MLFYQLNRTFSCSRVLLSPRSSHCTMVKDVVKTRTSKTKMWSLENVVKLILVGGSSRKQKTDREKRNVVVRKQPTEICGQ